MSWMRTNEYQAIQHCSDQRAVVEQFQLQGAIKLYGYDFSKIGLHIIFRCLITCTTYMYAKLLWVSITKWSWAYSISFRWNLKFCSVCLFAFWCCLNYTHHTYIHIANPNNPFRMLYFQHQHVTIENRYIHKEWQREIL